MTSLRTFVLALLALLPAAAAFADVAPPPLEIDGVTPSQGPADQDITVIIRGISFEADATVMLDATQALTVTAFSYNALEVTMPSGISEGPHSLTITNPGSQETQTLTDAYTATAPGTFAGPAIARTATPEGLLSYQFDQGATMRVEGYHFQDGATVELIAVIDNAPTPANATFVDANTLDVAVPEDILSELYSVRVTNPDGLSDTSQDTLIIGTLPTAEDCQCAIRRSREQSSPAPTLLLLGFAAALGFAGLRRRHG